MSNHSLNYLSSKLAVLVEIKTKTMFYLVAMTADKFKIYKDSLSKQKPLRIQDIGVLIGQGLGTPRKELIESIAERYNLTII